VNRLPKKAYSNSSQSNAETRQQMVAGNIGDPDGYQAWGEYRQEAWPVADHSSFVPAFGVKRQWKESPILEALTLIFK
jgi:hypothetical protein